MLTRAVGEALGYARSCSADGDDANITSLPGAAMACRPTEACAPEG